MCIDERHKVDMTFGVPAAAEKYKLLATRQVEQIRTCLIDCFAPIYTNRRALKGLC